MGNLKHELQRTQRLTRDVGQLLKALLHLLQVFVSKDEVDAILKCLPTSDELIKLQPYISGKRPLSDLAPVERFLLDLSKIPQIDQRLTTYLHKFSAPETLSETRQVLDNRKSAIEQVRACCPTTRTVSNVRQTCPLRMEHLKLMQCCSHDTAHSHASFDLFTSFPCKCRYARAQRSRRRWRRCSPSATTSTLAPQMAMPWRSNSRRW